MGKNVILVKFLLKLKTLQNSYTLAEQKKSNNWSKKSGFSQNFKTPDFIFSKLYTTMYPKNPIGRCGKIWKVFPYFFHPDLTFFWGTFRQKTLRNIDLRHWSEIFWIFDFANFWFFHVKVKFFFKFWAETLKIHNSKNVPLTMVKPRLVRCLKA